MSTPTRTKIDIRYVPDELIGDVMPKAMFGQRDGFLDAAKLESQDCPALEHQKRAANHPKNLETIYKRYQLVDGTEDERCAHLRIRSMSYGDAIVIDGVAYYVADDGFVVIEDDKVVPVEVPA